MKRSESVGILRDGIDGFAWRQGALPTRVRGLWEASARETNIDHCASIEGMMEVIDRKDREKVAEILTERRREDESPAKSRLRRRNVAAVLRHLQRARSGCRQASVSTSTSSSSSAGTDGGRGVAGVLRGTIHATHHEAAQTASDSSCNPSAYIWSDGLCLLKPSSAL